MPDEQEKNFGDPLIQSLQEALAIARSEKEPVRVNSYPLPRPSEVVSTDETPRTGAELVAFWEREGVVGSRADIKDPGGHARGLRNPRPRSP